MSITLNEDLQAFLGQPIPAVVSTIRKDGSIQMNPVWYDVEGNRIRLNPTVSRWWGKRLEAGAEVTLFFIDPNNMWRWAEIRGRVVEKTAEGGEEHIDLLSRRYLGRDYADHRPDDPRQIVIVEPVQVAGTFAQS